MRTVTSSAGSNDIPIKFPVSSFLPLKPARRLYETLGNERPRVIRSELLVRRTWNSTSRPFLQVRQSSAAVKIQWGTVGHYELVKFNVFIIARFPRRPRTKRATVNRRFLALRCLSSLLSVRRAIATKGKTPLARCACFLPLIISMCRFSEELS